MPGGDRTGPMGMGPMTGRGAGYCNGFSVPGYANQAGFYGGFGCGRGRGYRNVFRATGLPGWARYGYHAYAGPGEAALNEKAFLESQAAYLENQIQQLKKRLSSLDEKAE